MSPSRCRTASACRPRSRSASRRIRFSPASDDHGADAWQNAIRLADRALYAAKNSGRNAWVGLWGHAAEDTDIERVLRDPVQEERARRIAIVASRAAEWDGEANQTSH